MALRSSLRLIGNVALRRVPPRTLFWGLMNTLHRVFRTGTRRFEFERLYAERGDIWHYITRPEERLRYRNILDCILRHRRGTSAVLDAGCSVGAFAKMLGPHFDQVIAVDASEEALRLARIETSSTSNVVLQAADLRTLDLPSTFDVIVCAGILCYVPQEDAPEVTRRLSRHLANGGILVVEWGLQGANADANFDNWKRILGATFRTVEMINYAEPWPAVVMIFCRSDGNVIALPS